MKNAFAAGIVGAALSSNLLAGEGMWMPEQVPQLAPELLKMGLKIDPGKLADVTGDSMGWIPSRRPACLDGNTDTRHRNAVSIDMNHRQASVFFRGRRPSRRPRSQSSQSSSRT